MPSKKAQGPLLYIHQPFSRTPSIKMQDVYTIKREIIHPEEEEQIKKKQISVAEKEIGEIGKVPIPIEMSKPEKPQESRPPRSSFSRVKSFKEMNLQERLEYLINFPKVLPPVPCVFYTIDKNYQGYLIDHKEDHITIEFHDKTTKTLSVQELKNIIMIGIKK
jgi:hypothetical protein